MPQGLVTVHHIPTGDVALMHPIDAKEAIAQGEYAYGDGHALVEEPLVEAPVYVRPYPVIDEARSRRR